MTKIEDRVLTPIVTTIELRDYFAAAALPALLSSQSVLGVSIVAEDAYVYADAMIEARKQ